MGAPITAQDFISRHKADLQQAGFDNQFASFIYFLLIIDSGDEIIYEKEDDIVVSCADGCRWLIQVKHSVDKDTKMTDADPDFWKTIENWLSLYNFCNTDKEKYDFLRMGNRLILYTNKIVENTFAKKILELKNGDIADIRPFLQKVKKTVSYYPVVKSLLVLSDTELRKFLMKIEVLESGDPIKNLYNIFLQRFHNPTKADIIINELLGKMLREKKQAADNRTELNVLEQKMESLNQKKVLIIENLNQCIQTIYNGLSYMEHYNNCYTKYSLKQERLMLNDGKSIINYDVIGSQSNYMFLHLCFFLGLHRYFFENTPSQIGQFLFIDQPSIPYYAGSENVKTTDKEKLLDAFKSINDFMRYVIKEKKEEFQIILIEHAPESYWTGANMLEYFITKATFTDGDALIPKYVLEER